MSSGRKRNTADGTSISLTGLRCLNLRHSFLPLVELRRPLAFLRHLTLEGPENRKASYDACFKFLSPRYLPCLASLNLIRIYLNSPAFLKPFLTCAFRLKYLYLNPMTDQDFSRKGQPNLMRMAYEALPSTLLSACTSLHHLAINSDGCFYLDPTDRYSHLNFLPKALQTLLIDHKELQHLHKLYPESLPPSLSHLRQIFVCPPEPYDPVILYGLQCWAEQVGVNERRLSEYPRDWETYVGRYRYNLENDAAVVEVWNDLRESLGC